VLLVAVGISGHVGVRLWSARTSPPAPVAQGERVVLFSAYERLWHWLQALAILGLVVTGIAIHVPASGPIPFRWAVEAHNALGLVVVVNALFSAFYHLASGQIRQFLPRPRGFLGQAGELARYYLSGVFRGEAHPFERRPGHKLNPLQQLTYLVILNLLLPLQVVTGAAIWGAQRWPEGTAAVGGLGLLGPVHTVGAWLFAAFALAHVYLTTMGPTPFAHVRAMILGWDEAETSTTRHGS
jgi:thiosulfate reductase cytochrome b subunit